MTSLAILNTPIFDDGGGTGAKLFIEVISADFTVRQVVLADLRGVLQEDLPDFALDSYGMECMLISEFDRAIVYVKTATKQWAVFVDLLSGATAVQALPALVGTLNGSAFATAADGNIYLVYADYEFDLGRDHITILRAARDGQFAQVAEVPRISSGAELQNPGSDPWLGAAFLDVKDNRARLFGILVDAPYSQVLVEINLGGDSQTSLTSTAYDSTGGDLDFYGRFQKGVSIFDSTPYPDDALDITAANVVAPFPSDSPFGNFVSRSVPSGPGLGYFWTPYDPYGDPI